MRFSRFFAVLSLIGSVFAAGDFAAAQPAEAPVTAPAADGAFVGPLSKLVPAGSKYGLPTSGLGFDVTINAADKAVSPSSVELKRVTWWGGLLAELTDLKFDAGRGELTFNIKFTNKTGNPVLGLRLDMSGVAEEYLARNEKGELVPDNEGSQLKRLRPQQKPEAEPVAFGDLLDGQTSPTFGVSVSSITMSPDALRVLTRFSLSGVVFQRSIKEPAIRPIRLDSDTEGVIYIADAVTGKVFTFAGKAINPFASPAGTGAITGLSVNRHNRELLVTRAGQMEISRADATGQAMEPIKPGEATGWKGGGWVRSDREGSIFGVGPNLLMRMGPAGQPGRQMLLEVPGVTVGTVFDIDSRGNAWLLAGTELYRIEADQSTAVHVGYTPTVAAKDALGVLSNPVAMRTDKAGSVYVVEAAAAGPRITVLDNTGRGMRRFAMGAGLGAGELPSDLVFAQDGRLYVAVPRVGPEKDVILLVYQPF